MKIRLADIPTIPPKGLDKDNIKKETKELQRKVEELQNRLYAESKQSLLCVFQGMDAAGKGGAIRNTFKEVNPAGCRVYPFKKPSDEEFSHEFLWRVHKVVPPNGFIYVFDRSHYEDVLIQRVHHWIDEDRVSQRFRHINQFEELLIEENNTAILKFYMHVSEDEQLERLEERAVNREKMWKYNADDFEQRKFWPQYRKAYEDVFEHCSEFAPWHIIPTDKNWYKEYLVVKIVVETLEKMDPQYPAADLE